MEPNTPSTFLFSVSSGNGVPKIGLTAFRTLPLTVAMKNKKYNRLEKVVGTAIDFIVDKQSDITLYFYIMAGLSVENQ